MDDSQPENNSTHSVSTENMTEPVTEFGPVPTPSPSLEQQLHLPELSHSQRIFLDLCSGAGYPLSKALLQHQCLCFPVDILIDDSMDLLNNAFFEPLLRICASGIVAYGAGAPNCGEYSRLKLKPGGPPALRTPQFLSGVPNLSADSLEKVQQSFEIMVRIVLCLELIFSSGGHVHLEQPTNSMAWLESEVRRLIKFCAPHLVHLPACKFGTNWQKGWLFACSYRALISMSGKCNHPPGTHDEIAGVRLPDGSFKSRQTAEYPEQLCSTFATIVSPLCQSTAGILTLATATNDIPLKHLHDLPVSYEDGGGLHSQPDWSRPFRAQSDVFGSLRKRWMHHILQHGLHHTFYQFLQSDSTDPPFSEGDITPFREMLSEFLTEAGLPVSWAVRDDQPLHLDILHQLSQRMQDADSTLFPYLIRGVTTGIDSDIPPSSCFPTASDIPEDAMPLSIHMTNWQSAEKDLETTRDLVAKEVDKGWVYKYPGSLEQAQGEFGGKLAIGRLGLATSDSRPPRLVVDSSICGLNSQCSIPERTTLPSALDVFRTYPLREINAPMVGFSLDVKAAHKLVVLHESERGLVGFSLDDALYFYKTCPFGATFSAYHWTRLGSFILRWFHHLLWWQHAGFLYVDDFLFLFPQPVALVMATLLCVASQVIRLPISWGKCEFGSRVKWIGWNFYIHAGYISLPADKIERLTDAIRDLLKSNRTSKRSLEKVVGMLNWLTQVFILRTWMPYLYKDLFSIPASHYSINPGHWIQAISCLDDNLIFQTQPHGSGIPVGSKLLSVRHQSITSKADLSSLYLSERRLWLRVRDFDSSKRKLSEDSLRILRTYLDWINTTSLVKSLFPRRLWQGFCAADACAYDDICQIGGFIRFPSGSTVWYSARFTYADFAQLDIPVTSEMQKFIACFETLAQIALMFILSRNSPGYRFPLRIASLTDNSGTESGGNKLFSTTFPMNLFLEKLTILCTSSGMELDLSHISGERNDEADALSRWDFTGDPPFGHALHNRVHITLPELWSTTPPVAVHPSDTYLSWPLP